MKELAEFIAKRLYFRAIGVGIKRQKGFISIIKDALSDFESQTGKKIIIKEKDENV